MGSAYDDKPKAGLRERKKARTRAEIQRQALRLFRERGYEATTAAQIAEAAEVSESTFFRYFPTKEDVIFWDELDPLVFEAFGEQPPELGPVRALRESIRGVLARISAVEKADLRERLGLLLSVPPLRAMLLDGLLRGPMRLLAETVAERAGRSPDDPGVRGLTGRRSGWGSRRCSRRPRTRSGHRLPHRRGTCAVGGRLLDVTRDKAPARARLIHPLDGSEPSRFSGGRSPRSGASEAATLR